MSEEIFRFAIIRPAEPARKLTALQLNSDTGTAAERVSDKQLQQLASMARQGRDGASSFEPDDEMLSLSVDEARQDIHSRLLRGINADHLELADAARGLEILNMLRFSASQNDAAVQALAAAPLIASLRPQRISAEDPVAAERTAAPMSFRSLRAPSSQPRPSGFAELEVVKQHVVRYEAGEIAHIENVLAGEYRDRVHRSLDRSEDVSIFESETVRKESRDLATTERYELSVEAQKQLEQRTESEVGASISASYGPWVTVGLEASAGGSTVRSSADRRATQFSREITEQSASAISTRIREERKRTVFSEIEETNTHRIDNTGNTEHVTGIYQWVDKVMEAQVFSYGRRLMFDLTLPEPGAFLAFALTDGAVVDDELEAPVDWLLQPAQLRLDNWMIEASAYGASDVTAPPVSISKSLHTGIQPGEGAAFFTHSAVIEAEAGFRPVRAKVAAEVAAIGPLRDGSGMEFVPAIMVSVAGIELAFKYPQINAQTVTNSTTSAIDVYAEPATKTIDIVDAEPGDVVVGLATASVSSGVLTITVDLEPTEARFREWQYKAYSQIRQAHDNKVAAYQAALAERTIQAGISIGGRSPLENRKLERDELRKQAISVFTRQNFDGFGAVGEDVATSYPQIDLGAYSQQGAIVRFFEQAFEWQQMSWVLYPYYWSRKHTWLDKLATSGADPQHVAFLRSGAARMQLPVRKNFELAVLHFQATGEIWQGEQPPQVFDESYLPIVQELAEQLDRPEPEETPVGDPWLLSLPTDLVRLRPDGSLPTWVRDEKGHYVAVVADEE